MSRWFEGRLVGFDLETTGVDVDTDRIVTACVVACGGGLPVASRTWLADPGIDIPESAAKIHGVTTERARAEGRPAAEVVAEIADVLREHALARRPIVAMNAAFDLTLLDRECDRHGVRDIWTATPCVVDPRVLDKATDPYRRGGRKLSDLARHYRVSLDGAHSADADAIAACRVAWRIATQRPEIAAMPLGDLHERQVVWAREQAESLRAYFARTPGKESWAEGVRTEWPLIPRTTTQSGDPR